MQSEAQGLKQRRYPKGLRKESRWLWDLGWIEGRRVALEEAEKEINAVATEWDTGNFSWSKELKRRLGGVSKTTEAGK